MNREEILKKPQAENNGKDYADIEAQKTGTRAAYFVAVLLVIIVDTVNGFVLGYVNRGMDFVLFTMAFVAFLTKYIKLRKRHELIVTILWGLQPCRDPQGEETLSGGAGENGGRVAQHDQLHRDRTVQPDGKARADPVYRAG